MCTNTFSFFFKEALITHLSSYYLFSPTRVILWFQDETIRSRDTCGNFSLVHSVTLWHLRLQSQLLRSNLLILLSFHFLRTFLFFSRQEMRRQLGDEMKWFPAWINLEPQIKCHNFKPNTANTYCLVISRCKNKWWFGVALFTSYWVH